MVWPAYRTDSHISTGTHSNTYIHTYPDSLQVIIRSAMGRTRNGLHFICSEGRQHCDEYGRSITSQWKKLMNKDTFTPWFRLICETKLFAW